MCKMEILSVFFFLELLSRSDLVIYVKMFCKLQSIVKCRLGTMISKMFKTKIYILDMLSLEMK